MVLPNFLVGIPRRGGPLVAVLQKFDGSQDID